MRTVDLTHANSKEVLCIIPEQIFYVSYSPTQKCTMVVSPAGAYCLVLEPKETVLKLRHEAILYNSSGGKMLPSTNKEPVTSNKG